MNKSRRTITLSGIKHSGKSTLGRLLAERIDAAFYDVDEVIAEKYGQSVRELFRSIGEDEFRRIEAEIEKELSARDENKIISLGGGAVSSRFFDETLQKSLGMIIMVDIPDETAEERVFANGVPAYLEKYSDPKDALKKINAGRRKKMREVCSLLYVADETLSPEEQAEKFHLFLEQKDIL